MNTEDKKDSGIGAIDGNYLESVMDSIRDSIKIESHSAARTFHKYSYESWKIAQ
ncbi:hypothetical protein MNBD_NITROSPINAE04-2345 [hydrothermal vent metagenome]|uniref:Uncharacterized protein n=1 Tax=hydrothermal vent metagenome TaxID=652676 RepID=A0A3B1BV35_9ZZZZ